MDSQGRGSSCLRAPCSGPVLEMVLIRVVSAAVVAIVMTASVAAAQAPAEPTGPPSVPSAAVPAGAPAAPVAVTPPLTRSLTTKAGLLFNTVRPERVADFETVLWYLEQALRQSTDPTVRAQAQGWKVFKAVEPGPNASVLYVFVLDPAVPRADYGLGRILADAYPDKVQEIWRLYQGAVSSGGSLLNLAPLELKAPAPLTPPGASGRPAAAPPARTPPPPPAR